MDRTLTPRPPLHGRRAAGVRRAIALALIGVGIGCGLVPGGAAHAQDKRVYRLGLLLFGDPADFLKTDYLRSELARLGYVQGINLVIDVRVAHNDRRRLDRAVAELVALEPDVIVASGGAYAAVAAQKATSTIPVVFPLVGDPVGRGLVASLGHPGGNLTGNSAMTGALDLKRVQILAEMVGPGARIGVVAGAVPDAAKAGLAQRYAALFPGGEGRLRVYFLEAPSRIEPLFERMARDRVEAVSISASPLAAASGLRMLAQLQRYRLPAICDSRGLAHAGLLLAYALDGAQVDQSTARYVQKILSGARPADLPVEQMSKVELVVNLKAAKALNLKVPAAILARADEVIE